jgi:hypothetical protein
MFFYPEDIEIIKELPKMYYQLSGISKQTNSKLKV